MEPSKKSEHYLIFSSDLMAYNTDLKLTGGLMAQRLSTRLKLARKQIGSHVRLVKAMGIAHDSLARFIKGEQPKHKAVIDRINKYLKKVGI